MKEVTDLGVAIKRRCKELGIRQYEIEKICRFSKGRITRYVKGMDVPSVGAVDKMEKVLHLKSGELESMIKRKSQEDRDFEHNPHDASARELEVLAAWKRGERTPEEVQQITGYTLKVIYLYLPLTAEG